MLKWFLHLSKSKALLEVVYFALLLRVWFLSCSGGFTWGLCALASVGREKGKPVLGTWHHSDPRSWQNKKCFSVSCYCGMGDLAQVCFWEGF